MPKSEIAVNSNFSVISPMHLIKNTLMIGLDVAAIRASHVEDDLMNNKNNCISDGHRLKMEIRDLAEKCMNLNDDLNMLVFSEFRDRFSLCVNLTSKGSLLLHAFTLLLTDATVDCHMNTHPITLGHRARDDILTETASIEEMNKLENLNSPSKVYLRKHRRCASVVLLCSFMSIDQIKKGHLLYLLLSIEIRAYFWVDL